MLLAAAVVVLTAASARPAWADTDVVPTLNGEHTLAQANPPLTGAASFSCSPTISGSGSYDAFGVAEGTYGGTIEESATFTFQNGIPISYEGSFTIDSGLTHIEGTVGPLSIVIAVPICQQSEDADRFDMFVSARYVATIASPAGTITDHGQLPVKITMTTAHSSGLTSAVILSQFASDRERGRVEVTPLEAFNPVGTTHTVTIFARDAQQQFLPHASILITVEGSVSETGQCTTGSDGTCQFTYLGPAEPGADLITACYDFDEDNTVDPGENCSNGSKVWEEPTSTPGTTTGGGYITGVAGNRVVFGFGAEDSQEGPRGGCDVFDMTADVRIRCLDVSLLAIVGTHATISGAAMQNGLGTGYTIDVVDSGNPGAVADTFTIQTDAGYIETGTLQAGNIIVNPRL